MNNGVWQLVPLSWELLVDCIMQHINMKKIELNLPLFQPTPYRNRRDQLIKEAVKHINELRKGTKYRLETPAQLAIRVNKNPFLKSDGELELVLMGCKEKNNYAHLYWLLK